MGAQKQEAQIATKREAQTKHEQSARSSEARLKLVVVPVPRNATDVEEIQRKGVGAAEHINRAHRNEKLVGI
jgi:hypothetical protein